MSDEAKAVWQKISDDYGASSGIFRIRFDASLREINELVSLGYIEQCSGIGSGGVAMFKLTSLGEEKV